MLSAEQDRINRLKERINDLENDLKSQKRISSDLAIDNRSLKEQLENQPNSNYHNQSNNDSDQQVYDL